MNQNGYGLKINKDVISRMAETAAIEVNGVAGIAKAPLDIKDPLNAKGTVVHSDNGALVLDVYIDVTEDAKVRQVAEEVQNNVKDKIQAMTGSPVATVNVFVADIVSAKPTVETEEESV